MRTPVYVSLATFVVEPTTNDSKSFPEERIQMPDKLRVAVIGRTGRGDYGHSIDMVWQRIAEVEVVAVADDDPEGLARAAKRLGVQQAYADYRKMLDEARPEIVAVCPRWIDQHHSMVMAAVERGMHVFMEKPFCRTLAEADAIIHQADMTHALVAVAHQTHYSPKIPVVKQLIADGALGQVLEFRGRGKEDGRGGGEDLWVLGSHIVDLIRIFGGDAQWCFASVTSHGRPIRQADVQEGNEGIGPLAGDQVQAMYGMSGAATAYFASHRGAAGTPSRFGLQIYGSAGILEIGTGYLPSVKLLEDPSWSPGRSGKSWVDVSSAGVGKSEPIAHGELIDGNERAVRDLIESIGQHRQPLMNAREARSTIEMIAACFESAGAGAPTPLPLARRDNPLTRLDR
jgi:predicted dehydrogenase